MASYKSWYWTREGLRLAFRYTFPSGPRDFVALARRLGVPEPEIQELVAFRAAYPPQQYIVRGVPWTYIVTGQGTEHVVLLHGMAGAYDVWWRILPALARTYRVLSVTYPPLEDVAALAQGVLTLMDHLGMEQAHVIGSSLGGFLAQYLVHHATERVKKAVLGNTFPPSRIYRQQYGTLVRLAPHLPQAVVMAVFRMGYFFKVHPTARSPLLLAYLLAQSYRFMGKEDVVARARCVLEAPDLPPPPQGFPILIIEAADDPLIPPTLRQALKRRYPWATVFTFPQAGHFPYVNQSRVYLQVLLEFLHAR